MAGQVSAIAGWQSAGGSGGKTFKMHTEQENRSSGTGILPVCFCRCAAPGTHGQDARANYLRAEKLAVRGEFEPPIGLLTAYWFDKPAPSATRPFLRRKLPIFGLGWRDERDGQVTNWQKESVFLNRQASKAILIGLITDNS
jgi:hypothetical protein